MRRSALRLCAGSPRPTLRRLRRWCRGVVFFCGYLFLHPGCELECGFPALTCFAVPDPSFVSPIGVVLAVFPEHMWSP